MKHDGGMEYGSATKSVWKSRMKSNSSLAACKEELCATEPAMESSYGDYTGGMMSLHSACSLESDCLPATASVQSRPSSGGGFFGSLFGGSTCAAKKKKARV